MSGRFVAVVPGTLDGQRVDRAVSLLTGVSRAAAAGLVAGGRVAVSGRTVTSRSTTLREGEELAIDVPDTAAPGVAPDARVRFGLVHEDADLVVVDKPAGLVVHPGAGHPTGTLVAGLLARYPDIASLAPDPCDPARPGIVHRLDRGTSGLLVIARTPLAYRSLGSQMKARTVGRRYLALVEGHVHDDLGVVDAPIGRSVRTPTKMAVTPSGRPARTGYEVLDRLELRGPGSGPALAVTLLTCRLETGRTHQIRVHLSAIGHPVVGDDRYGPGRRRELGHLLAPGRVFLHAAWLSLDHPATGERREWESPLPEDLALVVGETPSLPRV